MNIVVSVIARVCHEVVRSYCTALGDHKHVKWEDAAPWQREMEMLKAKLYMDDPTAGPEVAHEKWLAEKIVEGWAYGPKRDVDLKTHPSLLPFAQLSVKNRAREHIFHGVVRSLM